MENERIPYRATEAAAAWAGIGPLPVSVLLENVRSFITWRVLSHGRCGVAGEVVSGRDYRVSAAEDDYEDGAGRGGNVAVGAHCGRGRAGSGLRARDYEIAAIETSVHAVDLFDWQPRFPVCVLFGHETDGLTPELAALADTHVRIPMLGRKHSLNVATAGGVVLYELLRKYRAQFPVGFCSR